MTEHNKHEEDNYELPPGIVLPQDDTPDYPNYKKGALWGIVGGFLGALMFSLAALSKTVKAANIGVMILLGLILGFLMVGSIVAFRPPKNKPPKL